MLLLALLLLAIGIACYSIRELQSQGKLKWQKEDASFWGNDSWTRKYKTENGIPVPASGWYYKLIKVHYKERWPTSTWLTVNLTDGYHALQSLSFLSIAGCVCLFSGINFFIVWGVIIGTHFAAYYLTQKR